MRSMDRLGPGVSVRVGDNRAVVTDAAGAFQVDVGAAGTYAAVLHGGAFVDRETSVAAPGNRARLSLIPSSFDLEAFDQMYRTSHGQLQRWTTQPRLVLVATVLNYRGANGDEYAATREQMTDDEVSLMLAHLTEGLTMLTGGTYGSFASVEIERPASDARVSFARDGKIVVGRFNNIVAFASTIGYGSWSEHADGSIGGGALFLDSDFDRTDARRRLLRIHELGHALGYQHVTSRAVDHESVDWPGTERRRPCGGNHRVPASAREQVSGRRPRIDGAHVAERRRLAALGHDLLPLKTSAG